MASYVALLRGINVGGKNKLLMKDLVALFERAGCTGVRNYIQSGNVVFGASPALAKGVAPQIEREIAKRFGLTVPVLLRTQRELEVVASKNPFLDSGARIESLYVMFLANEPGKDRVATLDPERSPADRFVVRGREIYISYAHGAGKTKLTNAWFDAKLATTSTSRNWKTVLKLVEMCAEQKA
jgi:uncharacterized protein (DUF1697 family)